MVYMCNLRTLETKVRQSQVTGSLAHRILRLCLQINSTSKQHSFSKLISETVLLLGDKILSVQL